MVKPTSRIAIGSDASLRTSGQERLFFDNLEIKVVSYGETLNGTAIDSGNDLYGVVTDSKTGKGIEGVRISDGYSWATTDANGVYQMKRNSKARYVFYSKPADYGISMDSDNCPAFYSLKSFTSGKDAQVNFTLTPLSSSMDNWTMVVLSDPQCMYSSTDAKRFKGETMSDVKSYISTGKASGTFPNPVGMTVGDIIFNEPSMWSVMKAALSNVSLEDGTYLPIYNLPGNHDHLNGAADDYAATANYVQNFGPTDYSFDIGKVHVVVMDDVIYTGKGTKDVHTNAKTGTALYDGGITDEQWEWFKEDIASVSDKSDKMVIFCAHIPLRGGTNSTGGATFMNSKHRTDILNQLKQFHQAHLMIGHTHYPESYVHKNYVTAGGYPVYEHILGATCGAWWNSTMNVEGSPNMYGVFKIEGNEIVNWREKATGEDESFHIRVFDGGQLYDGKSTDSRYWYKYSKIYYWGGGNTEGTSSTVSKYKGYFIADVWDSDASYWTCTLTINGKTYPMSRVSEKLTNASSKAYYVNHLGKTSTPYDKAMDHYYVVKVDGVDPATATGWVVTATQKIPCSSGTVNTYTATSLQKDYTGYVNPEEFN